MFVPRIASSLRKILFGEFANPVSVSVLSREKLYQIIRLSPWVANVCAYAPRNYLTFVSSKFFDMSDETNHEKSITVCCSVLTESALLCIMLLYAVFFLSSFDQRGYIRVELQ
jgi:hypothetical protein